MSDAGLIKLAIMAVGGQGGGVLTNWIVDLALANGYEVQSTAVAGVAQRTGATIYYIEMAPKGDRIPVFSLAPAAGDVDVLIAAELMEAGRAVMRGFVTPDRTTLIASTHRSHAVSEKIAPGDGRAPEGDVYAAMDAAAEKVIAFDMNRIAVEAGTVISASLFGALAGSGALPFPRESFEAVIRASGRGVEASLRAFATGASQVNAPKVTAAPKPKIAPRAPKGPGPLIAQWKALEARLSELPFQVREMASLGVRKVVDFQDPAYGEEYLDHLDWAIAADKSDFKLAITAAKHIANAMAYDDVVRVADLKTRASRFARVRREMGLDDSQLTQITEFMHPRIEEVCGIMPACVGDWIEAHPRIANMLDRWINTGRRMRTDSLFGFGALYVVAGMRPWRRGMLRHKMETAHLANWLNLALATAENDQALAIEILACRRLIKGYSDTHMRGHSKFDRVLGALPMLEGRADAADWLRRLRKAALKDEAGEALDGALQTIASFAKEDAA
jgi:indolepyruvate ferredoxin oxidoreductase beta subunit